MYGQIQTSTSRILIIGISANAYDFEFRGSGPTIDRSGFYYLTWKPHRRFEHRFKESENARIIGKLSELKDEDYLDIGISKESFSATLSFINIDTEKEHLIIQVK